VRRTAKIRIILILAAMASLVFLPKNAATQNATTQNAGIDLAKARQYFAEAKALCEKDDGKLWGVSLCGPMIFADPASRMIAANQADAEGRLAANESIFTGRLPDSANMANTATTWAGVKWTMVMWPLPEDTLVRARLMMHELFHRIQDDLGLAMQSPANAHLDTREGRIWLQLEWRALRQALLTSGEARNQAVADALLFRARRRALFAEAAQEDALEMNEGLAEYTGVRLRGTEEASTIAYFAKRMESAGNSPSFVRSFAYTSGPAYGLLLDASGAKWRAGLNSASRLGDLLRTAYGVQLERDVTTFSDERAKAYDGDGLRATEVARENERNQRIAKYRARLVDGPVLFLPVLEKFDFSFDPYNLLPLDEKLTIYPTTRVSDVWGVLEVSDGALFVREGGRIVRVVVTAPADANASPQRPAPSGAGLRPTLSGAVLRGDGWTLELAPGWRLAVGEHKGDFVLRKSE
jgi:hypothetical protein